jgi:PAS domain S-box-containing protein
MEKMRRNTTMKEKQSGPVGAGLRLKDSGQTLRQRAEEVFWKKAARMPENLAALSPDEVRQMLHELQVHQIELEVQNEELRRAQAELDASRARYFDLYDLAPVGYCTLSEKGLIMEANLTAATLLGVARSALIKQQLTRFILKEDQDIHHQHRKQLFETHSTSSGQAGEPQACELRMVKKDRKAFWVRLESTTAQDVDGAPVCRVVMSDITERKTREDEREITARLIILLVNMPGDFRELMLDLTASLQKYSRCEAVGIRLRDGDDYPYYETRGFPPTFVQAENHLCAYGPDGKILRNNAGNPVLKCMCGNILCGRFDPAKPFFTAYGSFWSNNTTALIASTNEADRQARTRNRCNGEGYESVALIPLRTGDQVFGLLQFNDHHRDCFTPDLIAHFERMADGLAIALSRRQDEEALREAEVLRRANEELKKINSMKSEFISVASHELRTPLTSIKNAIEILVSKKAGDLTENQERFLSMVVRNIDRLSTMINSLLDLSKLEAGKAGLRLSEVDIVGALHRVTEAFQPQADAKLQILTVDCSKEVSTVYADPNRIEQILYNLVSNATKFTPEGGTVQLSARQMKLDTESEGACQDFSTPSPSGWDEAIVHEWVEISVTDTGHGISPDDQVRIFEPFYQVGDVLMSRSTGSGLGLTIVKELVGLQMGKISVESKIGKGSRFFFTLPVFSPKSTEAINLHKEIRQSAKNYPTFSLLGVCFNHKSLSCLNHKEMNGYSDLLNQLMAVVYKVIRRSTDRIIAQKAFLRVIIILESTPKKEAAIVKRKLDEAFSLYSIVFEGKSLSVPTILGPVTFPEDGITTKELMAAIKERAGN